jgi:hypothetical protein
MKVIVHQVNEIFLPDHCTLAVTRGKGSEGTIITVQNTKPFICMYTTAEFTEGPCLVLFYDALFPCDSLPF